MTTRDVRRSGKYEGPSCGSMTPREPAASKFVGNPSNPTNFVAICVVVTIYEISHIHINASRDTYGEIVCRTGFCQCLLDLVKEEISGLHGKRRGGVEGKGYRVDDKKGRLRSDMRRLSALDVVYQTFG